MARNRPLVSRRFLELDLFREPKRIVNLYAEVANRGLDLRVTEQQLDGSQVACLPIELGDLGSAQRMGAEAAVIEPNVTDPPMDDACVLAGGNVPATMRPAAKQVTAFIEWLARQQAFDRLPCYSVISNCTGRPVFRCTTIPRSRTSAPEQMSSVLRRTRSDALSLLSIARLKSARSWGEPDISRRTLIDQTCLGNNGRFWPTTSPLFQGWRT